MRLNPTPIRLYREVVPGHESMKNGLILLMNNRQEKHHKSKKVIIAEHNYIQTRAQCIKYSFRAI